MVIYEYLVILLFTSGLVTVCSLVHREYHLINVAKTWVDAQSFCRAYYTDLATVSSHNDMTLLAETQADGDVVSERWIGLRKTASATWHWSVGEVSPYDNWADSHSDYCGGMWVDGRWYSTKCGHAHPFICQRAGAVGKLYMVPESKSWRQAQSHCRQDGSDLAGARSLGENQALKYLISEVRSLQALVGIGLFKDKCEWSDRSDRVFRHWHSTKPNNDGACAVSSASAGWYDRACSSRRPFYCHGEKRIMKQVVSMEMTSDSLLHFSDSAVGEAILTHIQTQNTGLTFQWHIQPNGKTFQKKENKRVTPSC